MALALAEAVGVGDAGATDDEPAIAQEPAVEAHVVGAVKVPVSVMPIVAEAPGASAAFHERLVAVSLPPESVPVAFHMLMLLPDHGMLTDQPLTGDEPVLVTVRSTLRPVPQSEVTLTPTVMAAAVVGVLDDVGDAVGEGDDVAVGVGATVGDAVGEAVGVTVGTAVGVGAGTEESAGAPTTEQVPAGIVHVVGARAPPRGAPMNPKVSEPPWASEVFQLGPAKR